MQPQRKKAIPLKMVRTWHTSRTILRKLLCTSFIKPTVFFSTRLLQKVLSYWRANIENCVFLLDLQIILGVLKLCFTFYYFVFSIITLEYSPKMFNAAVENPNGRYLGFWTTLNVVSASIPCGVSILKRKNVDNLCHRWLIFELQSLVSTKKRFLSFNHKRSLVKKTAYIFLAAF